MKAVVSSIALLLCCTAAPSQAQQSDFQLLGRYRGWGGLVASAVAPGHEPGSERMYASFLYNENTIDVISVDPETGATDIFHSPIQGDFGARNMAVGPDGNIYLGTLPHAHFLKLDRVAGKLIDLGQPSPGEQYIWDVTFGQDKKLYGATYPGCKLVRYDPATGKLEDLGRLDSTEQYARWIAASDDGFIYIGIGTTKANIAAFNVRTGQHREILPTDAAAVGTAKVFRAVDGNVYGTVGQQVFRLANGTATEWQDKAPAAVDLHKLRDGRVAKLVEATQSITVTDPKTHAETTHKVGYDGNELALFRVTFGPDGMLYGSAILPIHFVRVDTQQHIEHLVNLGGGEIYSMLSHDGKLLMGAYAGIAPLMVYTPGKPLRPAADGNPALVNFSGAEGEWRPEAMVEGSDHHVYIGAVPGYGQLEGPLLEWQPDFGTVQIDKDAVIKNQNISSLTTWRRLLVGGTTIYGGGGSHPVEKEARLFLWNTATHKLEFSAVPIAGAESITDLITAPNGLVYGIAGNQRPAMLQQEGPQHPPLTLFVFDPAKKSVLATRPLPFTNAIYNSVAAGSDAAIWGLAEDGIFRIDTKANDAALVAHSPEKITGGFDIRDGDIYFVSGPAVYRYKMQEGRSH